MYVMFIPYQNDYFFFMLMPSGGWENTEVRHEEVTIEKQMHT